MKELSEYDKQAQAFLDKFGITFKAKWGEDKRPPWDNGRGLNGYYYRVTLSRHQPKRAVVSFDFWDCHYNREKGITELSPYFLLASISSDVHCPDTFEDFCSEYGYEEDSRKAFDTFKRCARFAERLQAFFSEEERVALQEIR